MKYPKRLSSGEYIDLSDIKRENVTLENIVPALQYIFRFTGHHADNPPLTVAQHSLLTMRLAEEKKEHPVVQLCCLTHDFAEAFIGDVATPLKRYMGDAWYKLATPIEYMVNDVFSPEGNDPEMHERVKKYDSAALDIERRVMWLNQRGKKYWPTPLFDYGTLQEKAKMFVDVQRYGFNTPVVANYCRLMKELDREC